MYLVGYQNPMSELAEEEYPECTHRIYVASRLQYVCGMCILTNNTLVVFAPQSPEFCGTVQI